MGLPRAGGAGASRGSSMPTSLRRIDLSRIERAIQKVTDLDAGEESADGA